MISINKIMGVFMLLFGLFLFRWFPYMKDYQPKGFTWFGRVVGIPCIYTGIYLLLH